MGLNLPELSLEMKPSFALVVGDDDNKIDDGGVPERLRKTEDYVNRLEAEMRKIDAFKRELPLCMLIVNKEILCVKEELMKLRKQNAEPVLEKFIPLKKTCDEDSNDETMKKNDDSGDKKNWLSSTDLWNNSAEPNAVPNCFQKQVSEKRGVELGNRGTIEDLYRLGRTSGRAFMPFKGYFPVGLTREEDKELPVSGLSVISPGIKIPTEESRSCGVIAKFSSSRRVSCSSPDAQSDVMSVPRPTQQPASRKQRRCWSPELHRRFVSALQQLGGSHVATPKQIRELMKVDGLTNDEVKSHLQKYRIHTHRTQSPTSANQQFTEHNDLPMLCDDYGELSKQSSNSHSDSPPGPLQLTGTTGCNSLENEAEKSESHNWNGHHHTSGNDDI